MADAEIRVSVSSRVQNTWIFELCKPHIKITQPWWHSAPKYFGFKLALFIAKAHTVRVQFTIGALKYAQLNKFIN